MSEYRHQALIKAPIERVWELVGDPARHPEWFPRVVEVRGDSFRPGDVFVQVTRQPLRNMQTTLEIDRLEDMRELSFHCRDTGTYTHWLLTPARGDTFVEAQFGMEPNGVIYRVFDATAGRAYFRHWIEQSLNALSHKATQPT
ncbi:MAG TPA: SRPBCC family protein [Thermoleophilaceae bacterium]|nr:SRPBCC family protein [Thermoleophilaceae bacterium]